MSDNGPNTLPCEKLKGREHFQEWKFQMKSVLILDNTWCAIEGYAEDDKTDNTTRQRRNEKALAKINLSVDKSAFPHIINAKTAVEAWNALVSAYEDKGLNSCLRLLRRLCSIKLTHFSSMEEYVNEALHLSHQLSAMNRKIDDDFLAVMMLAGLPDNYEPMIMALESSAQKITTDLIKTKLLQDDKYTSNVSGSQNAYFSSHKARKKPWCWVCKVKGHFKNANCRQPNLDQKYSPNNKSNNANTHHRPNPTERKKEYPNKQKALLTQTEVSKSSGTWYVDSGASSHMSGDHKLFANFNPCTENKKVFIADNTQLECAGKGDIEVEMHNGETTMISNVMYVKD